MPSLKQIKNKISSVKGTRRIMSAMKLIAAVKLQRSQDILNAYRPYSDGIKQTALNVLQKCDSSHHELLRVPEEQKKLHIVFLSSDRGLCGSFNSSTFRSLENYLKSEVVGYEEIKFSFVGRKGRDYLSRRDYPAGNYYASVSEKNSAEVAAELADSLSSEFVNEETDKVILAYNYFKTTISQEVTYEQLLPFDFSQTEGEGEDYEYEPTQKRVLDFLIPKYMKVRIERAIHESLTSEHASRMTAMDNATRNADDVIDKLTLQYNKTRQSIITTELMDIVNGTEALKKGGA